MSKGLLDDSELRRISQEIPYLSNLQEMAGSFHYAATRHTSAGQLEHMAEEMFPYLLKHRT